MSESVDVGRSRGGLLSGLCDDAAIFPPGNLPLAQAVAAHRHHRASRHADLVGPFVVSGAHLDALEQVLSDEGGSGGMGAELRLAVTTRPGSVESLLERTASMRGARLAALEVTVEERVEPLEVVSSLRRLIAGTASVEVFVEVPRDERALTLIEALATTPFAAKFRTGGERADLYPDEAELANTLTAAVTAGVPFKATAGLHHAVRNTDATTGFEQHGFLNVMAATSAALSGAASPHVAEVLSQRDGKALADVLRRDGMATRKLFRSFGTCSIDEPVEELRRLGLLPDDETMQETT